MRVFVILWDLALYIFDPHYLDCEKISIVEIFKFKFYNTNA